MSKVILPYGDNHPCFFCKGNPFLCEEINYCKKYKVYINSMNNKICTSIEQSDKLLELGLSPVNTADFIYSCVGHNLEILHCPEHWKEGHWKSQMDAGTIPSWSLSALLELMPKDRFIEIELSYGGFSVDPLEYIKKWFISFENEKDYELDIKTFSSEHPIDAVFEMVCWLLEQGFIEKGGEK